MSTKLHFLGYAGLIVGFFVFFHWAYSAPMQSKPEMEPGSTIVGKYSDYSYSISGIVGRNERVANFGPALKSDDNVVIGALQAVMQSVYGDLPGVTLQPVVETVDENNFITFTMAGTKTYFQLFRNSRGQVGSTNFWRVPAKTN